MIAKSIYPLIINGKRVKSPKEQLAVSNGWEVQDNDPRIKTKNPKSNLDRDGE